jgi:UV DNA damage endonuclease
MKKLGLCCISLSLQDYGIKSSTMTKTRFLQLERKYAETLVADRTLNNIYVVQKTLEQCGKNGWNYRISSGMMPLETLPEANLSIESAYNYKGIKEAFDKAAAIIKQYNIRCSTHPDQFVVPASINVEVAKKSVVELIMHGKMMDMFGLSQDYNSPINIHMNCFKGGDLRDISSRFIDVYNSLPHNVKSRLVLENEDKPNSWNVQQLYDYVYQKTGIPITYDNLHNKCNSGNLTKYEAYELAKSTWPKDIVPLFHFSDSIPNGTNPRAHADYVTEFPEEYNNNDRIDLEMEFKAKDLAIKHFQEKFKYN